MDAAALKEDVALKGPLRAETPAATADNVQLGLELLDALANRDDFDAATRLGAALQTTAQTAPLADPSLPAAVRQHVQALSAPRAEAGKLKTSYEALLKNPQDPAANLAVGKSLCFVKNDWQAGLPHLALGSDAKLKDAAQKELAADPAAGSLAAADAWFDAAAALPASAPAAAKMTIRKHAREWYAPVADNATGLEKAKAQRRVAELTAAIDAHADYGKMWAAIRKAVVGGQLKKWDIVGGVFSRQTFEELPPDGAILVGFNYTTRDLGRFPGTMQAIYATAKGDVTGRAFGTAERGAAPLTARAKPGYAVGAIFVRGGGGFDAFQLIFMRVTESGLRTDDRYDGPKIGGDGGMQGTLGGDGNFIVGIHGKTNDQGKMEALSPISLTLVAPTALPAASAPGTATPPNPGPVPGLFGNTGESTGKKAKPGG